MRFFLYFIFACALIHPAFADDNALVQNYLRDVQEHSVELQILLHQDHALQSKTQLDQLQFDWKGYLESSVTKSEDPPRSPFSSDSTRILRFNTGLSKMWSSGFQTSLDYKFSDNFVTYPGRPNVDFMSPDLSLSLKSNLFQDLFSSRLRLVDKEMHASQKNISIETKIQKKSLLINSLLAWAQVLEMTDDLLLQQELCNSIAQQTRKLMQKQKRGLIPQREFLLSQKELNGCNADVKSLAKGLHEKKEAWEVHFNIDPKKYSELDIQKLFMEITQIYKNKNSQKDQVVFSKNDDLAQIQLKIDLLELQAKGWNALKKPDVTLELKTGLSGINAELAPAHENLLEFQYPYIYAGLRLDFPFHNKEAKIQAISNKSEQLALRKSLSQNEKIKISRFFTLEHSLDQDFLIYKDFQTNVSLSKEIFKEAKKDFNNGRIDFYALSEFQKGLIQSQSKLASLRTQMVVHIIEYIDYFGFFEGYL